MECEFGSEYQIAAGQYQPGVHLAQNIKEMLNNKVEETNGLLVQSKLNHQNTEHRLEITKQRKDDKNNSREQIKFDAERKRNTEVRKLDAIRSESDQIDEEIQQMDNERYFANPYLVCIVSF